MVHIYLVIVCLSSALMFGTVGGVAVSLAERFGELSMPGEAWYDGTCFLHTSCGSAISEQAV